MVAAVGTVFRMRSLGKGWIWRGAACGVMLVVLLSGCLLFRNHHAEGLRLLEAGRMSEAWEAFERGYEKDPHSPYSLNNMGYVREMRDGNIFEAARFYKRAIVACDKKKGDPEWDRLKKMAEENLERVLWKIRRGRKLQVIGPDPRSPRRTSGS